MSWVITKDFHFSYSHVLGGLHPEHPCGRLHGHNAVVRVELEAASLDATGFVIDYGRLTPLRDMLDHQFDHRHLNDVVNFNPTAELLARYVFDWCKETLGWPVKRVGWSETPKTWAWYEQ